MARLPFTDPGSNLAVNIFRVMNNAPLMAKGFSSLGSRILGQSEVDPKLRELVIDAISVKLNCPYEWSHHAKWALDVGATASELEALKTNDLDALGPLERLVVSYAQKVDDSTVSDDDITELQEGGLSDQHIIELTITAGFYGMTARFLNAMAVEYDADVPEEFEVPDAGNSPARVSFTRMRQRPD
ncbi:MAG: carboxymuconolactone decarboxylase family protein [Actinomycetota bacterium]